MHSMNSPSHNGGDHRRVGPGEGPTGPTKAPKEVSTKEAEAPVKEAATPAKEAATPAKEAAALSKQEKLKKRQEQLAAWKSKSQASGGSANAKINEVNDTSLSKEEQLKRRRAKLEAWKQKKNLSHGTNDGTSPTQDATESSPSPTPAETKENSLSRQQRIEEWKKKRLQNASQPSPSTPQPAKARTQQQPVKRLAISLKSSSAKQTHSTKKRTAFGAEDDDNEDSQSRPKFKKPTLDIDESSPPSAQHPQEEDEKDELDMFIENLSNKDNKLPIAVPESEAGSVTIPDSEPTAGPAEIEELSHPTSKLPDNNADSDMELESDNEEDEEQRKLLNLKLKLQNKSKELAQVDHSSIEYLPFRKNFYKPSPEIEKLSPNDVKALRLSLEDIKVRGLDCPTPIVKWAQLGLSSSIMSIIEERLKYDRPSAIQSQALPTIMSGRDVIGIAKTGSGKTISFILPMLRHIKDQPPLRKGDGPIGLIMTPTRELALQINKELLHFTKKIGLTSCCCYGGSSIEQQIAELKRGVEIVVGTPGRIIDVLAANGGRVTNLRRVTYMVLDEADRMFDMGFEPQVTKIFTQVRPDKQTVLFSATFPRQMELLAKKILQNPVEISVGGISVVAAEISQRVELFEVNNSQNRSEEEVEASKFNKLVELVEKHPNIKILIFVEKQNSADDLLVKLLGTKHPCLAIHGGKDQIDRKYAIKEFSSAKSGIDILIATSIAARGLDVKGLDLVINYDAPGHMEDYVHRVGRTGRAGKQGTAITFVTSKQERSITDLVKAMKMSNKSDKDIPPRLLEISNQFLEKVKAGKEKYYFGFGGRGLDNLQEIRDNNRDLERRVFGMDEDASNDNDKKNLSDPKSGGKKVSGSDIELPDFHVIEGRAAETSGPDRCKFHTRIIINDLPQKARWIVAKGDTLNKIIESTSTSITNKGQYYPPNTTVPKAIKKNGKDVAPPPKLYLLVEGLTEKAVRDANSMIRQKMIEGLEAVARDETMAPVGKYQV